MKLFKQENMVKGWFVGSFEPTAFNTKDCEVAVKSYRAGDSEEEHYHKEATEITLILSGKVKMFNQEFIGGDIIVIEPGESTSFEAIVDTVSVVVKTPGAINDKFLGKGYK